MQVQEIMTTNVIAVQEQTSVSEIAHLLFDQNLTGVPVVDNEQHVIGILTEYDLMSRQEELHIPTYLNLLKQLKTAGKIKEVQQEIKTIQQLQAKDLMTSPVVTVNPETDVAEAARLFVQHNINPLPVVDTNGVLAGIIARADIVKLFRSLQVQQHDTSTTNLTIEPFDSDRETVRPAPEPIE